MRPREATTASCPLCGAKGRKVGAVTVRSLLAAAAMDRLDGAEGFFFCRSEDCGVVFFHGQSSVRFTTASLDVVVFQKSTDPTRLVCYCFGHRVQAIDDDVARNGSSQVLEKIAEKCRQGLERCEEMNPQGSCCLGNVRQIVEAAVAKRKPSAAGVGSTMAS